MSKKPIDRATDAAEDVAGRISDAGQEAGDRVSDFADRVSRNANKSAHRAADAVEDAADSVHDTVHDATRQVRKGVRKGTGVVNRLHRMGVRSEWAYIGGFVSIGISVATWAASRKATDDSKAQSDRWGIFVGHWAPTFFALGVALKLEEDL